VPDAIALLDFRFQSFLLVLLCWAGAWTTSIHRTCVIPRRCYSCGASLLRLVRLHDLEVGFVGLHRQCSCGNVPVHSVFKGMNTTTTPLPSNYIDRSWERVSRKKLFSAVNPNSGIRADLCIVVVVRIEHIEDGGVDFLIVTLFICIYSCPRHCWIASGLTNRPYASVRLVPQLTYDSHRTSGLGELSVSPL
jgi:hypothetical protein